MVRKEVSCRVTFNLSVIFFFYQPRNETATESTPSRRRRDTGNLVLVSVAIRALGLLVSAEWSNGSQVEEQTGMGHCQSILRAIFC